MIERKIRLSDTDEVKDFVNAAGRCDFDIDACYNRAVIDAKSLLGMLSLDFSRIMHVKYYGKNEDLEGYINELAVE